MVFRWHDDDSHRQAFYISNGEHAGQPKRTFGWVPLDQEELDWTREALYLVGQPVYERLRSLSGMHAVTVVARSGDYGEEGVVYDSRPPRRAFRRDAARARGRPDPKLPTSQSVC